jgi:methyl-accepting chemotaxis protein
MEVVMSDTNSGLHATENTAEKFEEILASSQSVAPNIEELAKTMENLNATFQTFASNADVILSISINNANNSEEVTAATEQQTHALEDMNDSARGLSEVASKLNTITQQFIIK